jgi:hypothetical protein
MEVKVEEEEADAVQLEVAAILCNMSRLMRARERRKRRRDRARDAVAAAFPVIPSWGRRRPRSMPEVPPPDPPAPAPAPVPAAAERDDAASPDTPLAYPESGGDDASPKAKGEVAAVHPRDQVSRPPARSARARASAARRRVSSSVASLSDFSFFFERKIGGRKIL